MTGDTLRSVVAAAVALAVVAAVLGAVAPLGAASAVATQETSLAIGTDPATGTPNGTARLNLSLTNEGEGRSVGPVLRIDDLPPGFAVANQSSPNGTYRESTREWLWTRVDPGETVTASAVLSVPANATGEYAVPISADDGANATATASATVSVDPGGAGDSGADSGDGADGDDGSGDVDEDEDEEEDSRDDGSGESLSLFAIAAAALVVLVAAGIGYARFRG